jgi:hypothetical protein
MSGIVGSHDFQFDDAALSQSAVGPLYKYTVHYLKSGMASVINRKSRFAKKYQESR